MKVFVLYRPNSDHEREVLDYERDFTKFTQEKLELISLDTVEGAEKAELYGVTSYPAVIAVDDAGAFQRMWTDKMPLINELSYFTRA